MLKILKTKLENIYNNLKLYIKGIFSEKDNKELNSESTIKKSEIVKLIISENNLNYRIKLSQHKAILCINELESELKNIKDFINIQDRYVRISAEMFYYPERTENIAKCQTKTYGMVGEDYDDKMKNISKELVSYSERYDINSIEEVSFNITIYEKDYKITKKDLRNLWK